jgi:hypothetical protein
MYRWRIAGLLHWWGYNCYYSALSKYQINPFRKIGGLKDWSTGDLFLVYPGDDRKPLSSIRGEVHQESLEDMRILALVEAKAGRDAALGIISEGFAGELNFDNYPLYPAYYTGLRERAARIIRGGRALLRLKPSRIYEGMGDYERYDRPQLCISAPAGALRGRRRIRRVRSKGPPFNLLKSLTARDEKDHLDS